MKIIVIAGMPGAGKEEFLTVAKETGFPFLRMGDLVREAYATENLPDMSEGRFAGRQRELYGKDVWAKRALERMRGEVFLVDGCRSMDEVNAYRSGENEVIILGIHAPPSARYERLVKRAREDAPRSIEEFAARDSRETGWGLSEVLALADVMIVNDSSLEDFRERSRTVLERI